MKLYATFLAGALAILSYLPQASAEAVTFNDPYKMSSEKDSFLLFENKIVFESAIRSDVFKKKELS